MLISNLNIFANEQSRPMKLAKMFLDRYRDQPDPDGILQGLNELVCITQVETEVQLTAAQAYQQKLEVCHIHHYRSTDRNSVNKSTLIDNNPCKCAQYHPDKAL